jgi:hypothetical protein
MCGRYTSPDEASIEREFNVIRSPGLEFRPSYNVAPTQKVPVICQVEKSRRLELLRWGLIPFFAKGEPTKYSTINARIETVETAASYRGPWKRGQRCLQIAAGICPKSRVFTPSSPTSIRGEQPAAAWGGTIVTGAGRDQGGCHLHSGEGPDSRRWHARTRLHSLLFDLLFGVGVERAVVVIQELNFTSTELADFGLNVWRAGVSQ